MYGITGIMLRDLIQKVWVERSNFTVFHSIITWGISLPKPTENRFKLFWKSKTHFVAELHKIDLHIRSNLEKTNPRFITE